MSTRKNTKKIIPKIAIPINPIELLPYEVQSQIYNELPVKSLRNLRQSSSGYYGNPELQHTYEKALQRLEQIRLTYPNDPKTVIKEWISSYPTDFADYPNLLTIGRAHV